MNNYCYFDIRSFVIQDQTNEFHFNIRELIRQKCFGDLIHLRIPKVFM